MIIIAGYYYVDGDQRDRFVAAHREMVGRARRHDGCVDVALTADSVDPRRVNMIEVWRDAEALESWRAVSDPPETGIEIVADETVKRYDAEDGGPLF